MVVPFLRETLPGFPMRFTLIVPFLSKSEPLRRSRLKRLSPLESFTSTLPPLGYADGTFQFPLFFADGYFSNSTFQSEKQTNFVFFFTALQTSASSCSQLYPLVRDNVPGEPAHTLDDRSWSFFRVRGVSVLLLTSRSLLPDVMDPTWRF